MCSLADRFPRPRALRLAALAALVFAFGSVDVARGADAHGCPDVTVEGIAITSITTHASCEGASEVINAAFAYVHKCKFGCLLEAAGRTWEGIMDSKGELSRTPACGVTRARLAPSMGSSPSPQAPSCSRAPESDLDLPESQRQPSSSP
jgi:hypothetical protein